MKSIITAIIVLIVAFAAVVHNGGDVVQSVGPDRVSATRTSRRGNARRNHGKARTGRGASRKAASRDLEISVAGIVRSVTYTAHRARTAMEEALRAAGADSDREFAVVTVETQERGQVAMIYRRSAQQWKKVRRFLQVGHPATIGSRVRVYGFLQSPSDAPVDVPMDVSAINPPRAVTFYERDRKGETSRYYNQVADGMEVDQRTGVPEGGTPGILHAMPRDGRQGGRPAGRPAERARRIEGQMPKLRDNRVPHRAAQHRAAGPPGGRLADSRGGDNPASPRPGWRGAFAFERQRR